MNITKINQEKLLDFIALAMTKTENEEYRVMRLNTSNMIYKIYGASEIKGNLFIIGNERYLKRVKYRYKRNPNYFSKTNFRFKVNKFKKLIDNESKGFIIEFNDTPDNYPYRFKRIIGLKEKNYLYLNEAMDIYKIHSKENESNNIPITHFTSYINSLDYIFTYKSKSKKKILKRLNGKK